MIRTVVLMTAGLVFAVNAQAYSVSLDAPDSVAPGETFTVDIIGDFDSLAPGLPGGFLAGGLQMLFDSSLVTVEDFEFALAVDTDLSCPGAALCPMDQPGTTSIVWGQFLTDLIADGAGPTLMGTLTLRALHTRGNGVPGIELSLVDFSAFTGGWFAAGFVDYGMPPDFFGATIEVVIPLPAAVWLMVSGLGLLLGFRRA